MSHVAMHLKWHIAAQVTLSSPPAPSLASKIMQGLPFVSPSKLHALQPSSCLPELLVMPFSELA